MKFIEFLQGKWLGHPLHPALVHVPVGGWIAACAFDVAGWAGSAPALLGRVALWCVGGGLAGALLATATGVADWSLIKPEKPAWKLALYHLLLNLVATLIWAVNFGLRLAARGDAVPLPGPVLATSLAGTALVLGGGYLGKLLVFDHGIGVARSSKKKWRQIAARGGANLPEEK